MNLIEHFFEQQHLRTQEEVEALDHAAANLVRLRRILEQPEEFADLPPHLMMKS